MSVKEIAEKAWEAAQGGTVEESLGRVQRIIQQALEERDRRIEELKRYKTAWDSCRALVAEQAMDEGLWFVAATAPEGYLQQELRRLHTAIEAAAKEQQS